MSRKVFIKLFLHSHVAKIFAIKLCNFLIIWLMPNPQVNPKDAALRFFFPALNFTKPLKQKICINKYRNCLKGVK